MRKLSGAVCFSLLLSAVPANAFDQSQKDELGKISTAYEQYFNKQDAAGITSLFAKNYLRVTPMGIVDNTKYYEGAFKAGMNHLEIRTTDVQLLSENMAMRTGEARVTGKSEKGDPLELNAFWTRTNPHSAEPNADCGEVDECEEVVCSSVISRGKAAEVFELVEATLDAVA
ncbi:ketosteroid isomerase-like protein [Bradyrhizobium sp. USDA 4518]